MRQSQLGFTFTEIMVTVAILAIVVRIMVPSFTEFIASGRVTSQTNALVNALQLARSEAVRRGAPVCVKRTTDNWANGWQVFVEKDNRRVVSASGFCAEETDATKKAQALIQTHDARVSDFTMASTEFTSAVRFNALGVSVDKDDKMVGGSFQLCRNGNEANSRQVSISATGMVSIKIHTCSN